MGLINGLPNMKYSGYIKRTNSISLVVLIALWVTYFFECLYKSQTHHYIEGNWAINYLNFVSGITNGIVIHPNLFGDEFYLEDFPRLTLIFETIYLVALFIKSRVNKQKPFKFMIVFFIFVLCFLGLFSFMNATLKLFVPG